MPCKLIRRIVVVSLLAACLMSVTASAQKYKTLLGKWNMTSETDGDPVSWTLLLKDVDGKLTAVLTTDGGEQAAKDCSYADGVLKFKAPYEGEDYNIELKLVADKLDGNWSGGGSSGRTSGARP